MCWNMDIYIFQPLLHVEMLLMLLTDMLEKQSTAINLISR